MSEISNYKRVSRRSAIKGSVSTVLFSSIGTTTAQAVSKTPIVTEISGDGEEYIQQVPTRWWEYNIRTRNEMLNARDDLGDMSIIESIGRSFSGDRMLGRNKPVLDVKLDPTSQPTQSSDSIESLVPSSFNGIPIQTRKAAEFEPELQDSCPYLVEDYSTKRAGQAMRTDVGRLGTIGSYAFKQEDDTIFFVTSSHLFGTCDGRDKYESMTQGDDEMGFVQYQNTEQDWAAVAIWINKESDVSSLLQRSGRSSKLIHGHYTKDGIDLIAASNGNIYRQGRSTGYHENQIEYVNQPVTTNCLDHREGIEYRDMPSAEGDSGGPVFADSQADNGSVSIIGFHSQGIGDKIGESCVQEGHKVNIRSSGVASPAFFAHREQSIWFGAGERDSKY